MTTTADGFAARLAKLKADLVEQGRRVQTLIEAAFESVLSRDTAAAGQVIGMDEKVDQVDVELEKASVQLLQDATREGAELPLDQLRMVLTIVKINNELERIADAGVAVAEHAPSLQKTGATTLPETFRVLANSVIGILRDADTAFARLDPALAKVVLASEDAVEEFKKAVLREAQTQVAKGVLSVDAAFLLQELATNCEIMAGHCTNIAEQVIYVASGKIVRHMAGHWEQYELPKN
jgi:phosphate transport system protein